MKTALAAAFKMSLKRWDSDKLVALNLAISAGHVPVENSAFKDAVELGLIRATGYPTEREELEAALTDEVNARVDAGTFS